MPTIRRLDEPVDPNWRCEWAADVKFQRVRPAESFEWLPNPHKGTTTFQRFNGDPLYPGLQWSDKEGPIEFGPVPPSLHNPRYPDTTMSYCRWIWSVIEPEKGRFRWDIIDGALRTAAERGQTLQVRIQPYIGNDMPEWYWKMGGTPLVAADFREGRVEPDHNNPAYLAHWADFLRAFAARYDGHGAMESFDCAYGGACGECGGNSSDETAEALMDVYLDAFKKTPLILMLGTHGATYAAAKDKTLGWRADCYGDLRTLGRRPEEVPAGLNWKHMYDAYPMEIFTNGVAGRWRTAPVTLETCWTVGHWYKEGWDIDWIIEHGLKYHLSVFMPKSSYIPEAWKDKIDAFNRRMGYRFVLRQMNIPLEAARGSEVDFAAWIDNVGVAPIYRPYRFAYRFRQGKSVHVVHSAQDIRTWMPEYTWFTERITLPAALEPGIAKVDVGVVSPSTDAPVVRLAIEDVLEDGWHPMGVMNIR